MNTSTVSARPATSDDLDQMLAIERQSYPTPWGRNQFEAELNKPFARVMVLTDDDTDSVVVGYIVYWVQAEGVSLLNIAIEPKWRGFHFAKKLMHVMINEAVRDEIPRISLEVRASNTGAIALYESLGFKKTHERKKFYNDGETAIAMEIKSSDITTLIQ